MRRWAGHQGGSRKRVITNLGVADRAGTHYVLRELAPGVGVDDLVAATDARVDTSQLI